MAKQLPPLEIEKEILDNGDRVRFRLADRYVIRADKDSARVYYRATGDADFQLVKYETFNSANGIEPAVSFARGFLERRIRAERAHQDRLRQSAEDLKWDNVLKNPERAVAAARYGPERPQVKDKPQDKGPGTFEEMKANPAHAIAQARQAEREGKA